MYINILKLNKNIYQMLIVYNQCKYRWNNKISHQIK
jgi:hypothetical protein